MNWQYGLTSFSIALAIVLAATPLIRKYAVKWKIGDKPNGRKIHAGAIPHLGGIGMVLGFTVAIAVAAYAVSDASQRVLALQLAAPVALIVALGIADDIMNLRAAHKLAVQIVSSVALAMLGVQLLVGLPGFDGNAMFVIVLTSFYLVGMSSAVNLIDGHDGVAAGVCAISAAGFAAVAAITGTNELLLLSLAVVGVCVGFLAHNFPPARIFMGDTGSMFLGLVLGLIACGFTMLKPGISTFVAVNIVLALPIIDAWLAIARRLTLRRPVFQADHMHMHHVLRSFGFSARQTVVILYLMQTVMTLLGVLAMTGNLFCLVVGLTFLVILSATFYRMMLVTKSKAPKLATRSMPSLEK